MKQKYMMTWALLLLIVLPCNLAMATSTIAQSDEQQESIIINRLKVYTAKTKQQVLDFGKRILGHEQYSQEEVQLARAKITFAFAITALLAAGVWRFKPRERANNNNSDQQTNNQITNTTPVTPENDKQALTIDDKIEQFKKTLHGWALPHFENNLKEDTDKAKEEVLSLWKKGKEQENNIQKDIDDINNRLEALKNLGFTNFNPDELKGKSFNEIKDQIKKWEETASQGWLNRLLSPWWYTPKK